MLIHNISQLLTMKGGPQRGHDLGKLGLIEQGALLMRGENIEAVGTQDELLTKYPDEPRLDANGKVILPGFVDPHTHLVWAGDRAVEFEMRLEGRTYLEILAAGGGIISTVEATRSADYQTLFAQTRARAKTMFRYGTTTAEAKTGYGLECKSELDQLQILMDLDKEGPLEIVPTFLPAHAVAPEYKTNPDEYVRLICSKMLPAAREHWVKHAAGKPMPFVDVFCETGAFDLVQSRRIFETARDLGFPLKIHADEFDNLGGARLAAELGAASADHLVKTSLADIEALAASSTVAVALPCTPFGLGQSEYTPARQILDKGGLLALATDCNPGTAWCENMQFVIALACRALKLTPAQAIAASTINSAAAIQRADRIGSIEPGKQADLVFLSVDDYRHLGYRFGENLVNTVVKKGRIIPIL
ncbi:imidazolonepropionase [Leptolinea tardivitalis]|uniref:Imidazolonepropionase n=1 Tax=Leptolinea tardivitalis TaxID=229920 RepID=A0A0P6XRP9_9CHLR|nr:imidazolonepropionase [Leptolinea tardivitalis]KPL75110.1 imidazolonepropionase [Leptolinea tardivitalis]GAP20412.1 imidazolonepropionase [Leptolinea tardivitalis]